MPLRWPNKDPNDVLDYQIEWSNRLDTGDTILTSTWIVPTGITGGATSKTETTTTIWLSGGTVGSDYSITNRIVTTLGRTIDQNVIISVRET